MVLPEPQVTPTHTGVVCPDPLRSVPQLPDNFVYQAILETSIGSVGLLARSVLTLTPCIIFPSILYFAVIFFAKDKETYVCKQWQHFEGC